MTILELAARLRTETHTLHRQVERSAFMAALLSGQLNKHSYCLLLRNLEPIYAALEVALTSHADHIAVAPVYFPTMFRLKALHSDLELLGGPAWRSTLDLLPACTAYVDRLNDIQATSPELLVAHAYVRYLGDLSGGQMLQKVVSRSLQLTDVHSGTAFYDFGDPVEVATLSQAFRNGINTLESIGVLAEAKFAFEMHGHLFDALAVACSLPAAEPNAPQ